MPFISSPDVESKSFDYVVIGGGTAGLTVAARLVTIVNSGAELTCPSLFDSLAEQPEVSVLVIEAGEYHGEDPLVDVPGNMFCGNTCKVAFIFKNRLYGSYNRKSEV